MIAGTRKGKFVGSIFPPEQAEDGAWACRVTFEGVYQHDVRVFGHDSFQALSLAIKFYNSYLVDRIVANPDGVFDEVGPAAAGLFQDWGLS